MPLLNVYENQSEEYSGLWFMHHCNNGISSLILCNIRPFLTFTCLTLNFNLYQLITLCSLIILIHNLPKDS